MYVVLGWFEVLSTMNQYSTVLIFGSYGNAFCVYKKLFNEFQSGFACGTRFWVVLFSF